jgi:hypothetical protein
MTSPETDNRLTPENMVQAGIVPLTWVALGAKLQGDWRKETGQGLARVMGEHLPFYGNTIASYMASKQG